MSGDESKSARIECNTCGVVDARILGTQSLYNDETPEPQATLLLECPRCSQPLLGQQWYFEESWHPQTGAIGDWTPLKRVWPQPDTEIPWELPEPVRDALREAQKCLSAQAYIASAAMSGRALEALCRDLNANESMLAKGLQELRDSGKIDERLYEWGVELHAKRNIAAHPDPTAISRRDAEYVFDFVLAICDYVYVLTAKFAEFKAGN